MTQVIQLEGESEADVRRQLSLLSMKVRARGGSVLSLRRSERQAGRPWAAVVCELP